MEQEPHNQESRKQESKEPTLQKLVETCREVLSQEDCDELTIMDFDDALNNAATMLEEQGVDRVEFLTKKGILEQEVE